ncbi:hypothetical protein [Loigolactobacillus bifermentans]|jgi:hypothetical protein|uniref:Glycosyltransferase RgtA/B/C/D-like domain-containing protein n=2 Tax=Loigolactobacillus bifermentans TaxID=1607 RepID=A0A0R1H6L0_9LACO|nr:hypothetical protein [Loigolactobacillus bifermentans]KRK39234.1 hypothetical protein FC07_GL002482 [Loigolactobacillus bifermentans DSM 20003]
MQLFFRRCLLGLTAIILGRITWFAFFNPVDRQIKLHWFPPFSLLIFSLVMACILIAISGLLKKYDLIHKWFQIGLLVIILGGQLWLGWHIVGFGALDPAAIRLQATALAHGSQHWFRYFSWYPNNVNITLIFAATMHFLGMSQGLIFGRLLNLIVLVHIDGALALVWWWFKRHLHPISATMTLLLSGLFLPITVYSLNYYTDGIVLLYPMLCFTCLDLAMQQKRLYPKLLLTSGALLSFTIAYLIKGNTIVFGIASLMALLLTQHHLRQISYTFIAALIGVGLLLGGSALSRQIATNYGYDPNPASAFPTESWTLMGLNKKSKGAFSQKDINKTTRLGSVKKNKKAVKKALDRRLKKLGTDGLFKQFRRKTITMWSTGTMGMLFWPDQFTKLPITLHQHQKGWQTLLANIVQIIYINLLGFAIFALLRGLRQPTFQQTLFSLGILGIFFLHILFWEVEARYAFLTVPILIGLAASGIAQVPTNKLAHQPILVYTSLSALLLCQFINADQIRPLQKYDAQTNPVITQNVPGYFQMSHLVLAPGQTYQQTLNIPNRYNRFVASDLAKSGPTLRITLQKAKQQWSNQIPGKIQLKHVNPAGKYQLILHNSGTWPLNLSLAHSPYLKLATTALKPNYYVKYRVQLHHKQPLITPTTYRNLFMGTSASIGLILIGFTYLRRKST